MAEDKQPTVIKKYANRRLYNTGTSTYVTLEDLAVMVKAGEDFVVFDAKSGDDITRSVLAQIIFEQEGKVGQNLLPIAFLRQLIRFYGDSIQTLVPSYLEFSIGRLTADQQKFREQLSQTLGAKSLPLQVFGAMEEQARKNMQAFSQALSVFSPFAAAQAHAAAENGAAVMGEGASVAPKSDGDLQEMRRQLQDMQKQIETLARKP
jgi:polyhydroxyalkanoate synthesis repressor PhaR